MSWLSALRQRLHEAFRPDRAGRELRDELRDHFQHEVARQLREGTPVDDARRAAAARVGNLDAAHEAVRDGWTGRVVRDALADARLAIRTCRRNPGFAAAVVVSLALGVGGTTAVFTLVNAVLLRPLPYADPGRLAIVRIWWNDFSASLSPADLLALEDAGAPVAPVGAYFEPDDGFALAGPSGPELVEGAIITPRLLPVLGVTPIVGPGFSSTPNAPEALISENLWRTRYGGEQAAIGKSIVLDGDAYTVVGVMPSGFDAPGQRGGCAWLKALSRQPTRRAPFYYITLARLPKGLTPEAAAARLTTLIAPVLEERYGVKPTWRYGLRPLHDTLVSNVRESLLILLGAAALVLVVAIVNVTNLMLARGAVRARELAVRASLGAGRGRLARHLLAEAALLGALGGIAGVGLAASLLAAAEAGIRRALPTLEPVRADASMFAFALACGIGAALLASLLPVVRLPWTRLALLLRDGGRGHSGGRLYAGMRQALVVAELALTVTVLIGAVLLGRSLARLQSVSPGFDAEGRTSFRLTLPDDPYDDEARLGTFVVALEDRLRGNPGVRDVAFSLSLPPNLLELTNNFTLEGRVTDEAGANGVAEWNVVSPSYFTTLGIPLISGRALTPGDREGAPLVAVVNESFARRHYPDGKVLGARLKGGDFDPRAPWTTIVGVVADVPYGKGLWGGADSTVYVAQAQNLWLQSFFVIVRADDDLARILEEAQQTILSLDARLPVRDPATMARRLRDSTLEPRLRSLVFALVAGLALALAVTGVYGVMAYQVNLRRHETAIRRALGASGRDVVAGVMASGLRLMLAGLVLGAAGALLLARTLSAVLFQVTPRDPGSFALVAVVLAAATLLACGIPASRSAAVDPAAALREDG